MENIAQRVAGKPDWYPEADTLINTLASELPHLTRAEALRIVRDIMLGMTKVDLRGLISVGDEHEWGYLSIRSNELAIEENR